MGKKKSKQQTKTAAAAAAANDPSASQETEDELREKILQLEKQLEDLNNNNGSFNNFGLREAPPEKSGLAPITNKNKDNAMKIGNLLCSGT